MHPTFHLISSEAARPVPKSEKPDKPLLPPNLEHASAVIAEKIDHDEEVKVPNALELKTGVYEYPPRARFMKSEADSIPIPRAITDQIKTVEYRLFAGLFPEINRAYVTLDDKLFLWNFEGTTGQDFTAYTANQIIISVALVKPIPGVFVEEIVFLLVVATATEIRLLGAIYEEGKSCSDARIELYPTSFVVPSDGVHMIAICGTSNGRIFMCGRDGCVYELVYQSQDGWFTRKCRKLNHSSSKLHALLPSFVFGGGDDPIVDVISDNTRTPNLLITLSRSSEIQVFSLGPQGEGLIPLSKYNASRLQSEVKSQIGNATFVAAHWEIVALAKVPEVESRQGFTKSNEIVACAITAVGHRIFFQRNTTTNFSATTSDLRIHCVRQCPKQTRHTAGPALGRTREPGWSDESPEHVRKTYYGNGVLLLADAKESADSLVAISRDPAVGNRLVEYVEVLNMPQARVSDIAEVRPQFYLKGLAKYLTARGQKEPLVGLSEFATQHEVPCREFLVLTSTCVQKFMKLRPVDELGALLKSRSSDLRHKERTDALKAFSQHYSLQEFCAMCLVIACKGPKEAADSAAPGLFSPGAYGGSSDTEQLKLEATQAFFEFSAQGPVPIATPSRGDLTARATTLPTHRAAGFALFMSRVLRAVWEKPIYEAPGRLVWGPPQIKLLVQLQGQIRAMKQFLEDKRFWERPLLGQPEEEELYDKEAESLGNMRHLLDRCLEALALLVALAEQSNITQIFQRLPPQHLEVLKEYDFSRLVTKGEQLGEALIKAMMQPGQKEDWVRSLQQRCPTYFGMSQMFLYKGDDCVEEAFVNFSSQKIRMRCLTEAMQHYGNAVRVPRFDLEGVCANLRRVHYYAGAVDLCQLRAQYIEEEPDLPAEQRELERNRCTNCILDTLDALKQKDLMDPTKEETIRLTPAEKEKSLELVIQHALRSPDEKFHRRFYTWFIEHPDMTPYLLRMESPFLLRFLDESQDKKSKQILKDYLVATQHYAEAARFLSQLANTPSREYTLDERVEALSHALHYARMCQDPENPHQRIDGELIFTIGDQLELCRIQKLIYDSLKGLQDVPNTPQAPCPGGLSGPCPSHKFACLDQQLFTIDPLYHNYAENFQLWEAILRLLQFEGALKEHTATITATWKNIIVRAIRADKPNFDLWRQKLELTIKALYQQYHSEPELFPLKLVVEEVQRCHSDKRWVSRHPLVPSGEADAPPDWGWVVDCFVKAHVQPLDLLAIYEQLLEVPQVIGAEKEAVLWSCYRLLQILSEPHNQKTYGHAGHGLLRACEDDLSSGFEDSPASRVLKRKFAEIKARYGRDREFY